MEGLLEPVGRLVPLAIQGSPANRRTLLALKYRGSAPPGTCTLTGGTIAHAILCQAPAAIGESPVATGPGPLDDRDQIAPQRRASHVNPALVRGGLSWL